MAGHVLSSSGTFSHDGKMNRFQEANLYNHLTREDVRNLEIFSLSFLNLKYSKFEQRSEALSQSPVI